MSVSVGLFLFIFAVAVFAKNEILTGYKVYKVNFETEEQQAQLDLLKDDDVDFWRYPVAKYGVDGLAMVPPTHFTWFEERLEQLAVKKEVVIEDVYEYLKQKDNELVTNNTNIVNRPFSFDAYHRYDEIEQYLREISMTHIRTMKLAETGRTEENRILFHLQISSNRFTDHTKPIIVIEAGIIAREWITIPAAINIIEQLHAPTNVDLINEIDWIIIPVVNPDGYEYSHTNLRSWKKNRSTQGDADNLLMCVGANINRNMNIAWGGAGSSSSPCSHEFAGIHATSEYESEMLESLFEIYGNRIKMYISIQNQGPLISYPWRFEQSASGMFRPHHLFSLELLRSLGMVNEPLDIASIAFGGRASGTSSDYMQDNGVLYSLNLGVRQAGRDGFIIPEANIRNSIEPIWRAVKFAATYLIQNNRR